MIGEKGNPSEANRTITVKMYDNYFEPAQIQIKKDETIKFIVLNVAIFLDVLALSKNCFPYFIVEGKWTLPMYVHLTQYY